LPLQVLILKKLDCTRIAKLGGYPKDRIGTTGKAMAAATNLPAHTVPQRGLAREICALTCHDSISAEIISMELSSEGALRTGEEAAERMARKLAHP
jgi:hypothetical protein